MLLSYKQNKFNLLREQSEGYSKLAAELTSSLGFGHSPATGRPTEPYSVIEARARIVWEKVNSLIGYFDLDPARVLDMILDVLSIHLVTHYTFFLALLSFSPWAGSYQRPVDEGVNMTIDATSGMFKDKNLDEVLSLAEPVLSQPSSPGNVSRMAQVLGFKFVYYQAGVPCTFPNSPH